MKSRITIKYDEIDEFVERLHSKVMELIHRYFTKEELEQLKQKARELREQIKHIPSLVIVARSRTRSARYCINERVVYLRREFSKFVEEITVKNTSMSNVWYRVGLALTDGSVLGPYIRFASTDKELCAILLKTYPRLYVRFGCIHVLPHEVKPMLYLRVKDPEVTTIVTCLRRGVVCFPNTYYEVAEFLSGLVDGDGTVNVRMDKDGWVHCSIYVRCSEHKLRPILQVLEKLKEMKYIDYTLGEIRENWRPSRYFRIRFSIEHMRKNCLLYLMELRHRRRNAKLRIIKGVGLSRDDLRKLLQERVRIYLVRRKCGKKYVIVRCVGLGQVEPFKELAVNLLKVPAERVHYYHSEKYRKYFAEFRASRHHVEWLERLQRLSIVFGLDDLARHVRQAIDFLGRD